VLFAVAAILACVAAYLPALQGPFLFDDIPNLLENRLLRVDWRVFDDWRVAIISNNAGLFHRPVAMATFAMNYVAAGDFSPLAFKGTNLAIHLSIGILVYFLCRALLQAPALAAAGPGNRHVVALVAAALWLLHPLHVSTVLYVVQRMAQLSSLFTVVGLLVYCRYRLRWAASGASTGELIAAALWLALITVLATLAKENGALLPWLIAVVEVVLFRGAWDGRRSAPLARLAWVAVLLPVLLLALVLLFAPEVITGRYGGREFTLEERVLTQARLLWRYLGWILLPNIASTGFFHDDIPLSRGLFAPLTTLLSLVAWGALTALAIALRRRYPLLLFALFFYLVGHAMESTVLPLEMVFEHRNYLPAMGVCLLAAVALFQIGGRMRRLRPRVFVLVAFVVLSAQLMLRAQAWTDELSLARFNVINHPDSPRANFYYGNTLFERFARAGEQGLDEEEKKSLAVAARAHFLRMHNLAPGDFPALVMLYQLDTLNFPALAEENDWLGKMEELARVKRLHASDRTALASLVAFSATEAGREDFPRVLSMLEHLVSRYPRRVDLLALHYKVLVAQPGADRRALRAYLERAVGNNPDNRLLYGYMVQYHGAEDMAATYETVRAWMRLDTRRRELAVLRRMFNP
jgi:hypothetical protein